MLSKPKPTLVAVLGVVLLAAGCSDPTPPPAPTPVVPTITDSFSGTLLVSSSNVHPFTVHQVGGVSVTLTSVDPGAAVRISVGTPSTTTATCTVINGMTIVASPSAQLSGTATVTGDFCVSVADVGNLVEPVNYTITVLHS